MAKDAQYWDSVSKTLKKDGADLLWRSHSDAVNTALLDRWLPSSDRVNLLLKTDLFDEAFGNGLFPILASQAHNIIGIDISASTVNRACERNNRLFGTSADLRCLPFNAESFDIIISNSSLDHFDTRREIIVSLREVHRVLRKGGQLIITIDNLTNPVIALRSILPFRFLYRSGIVPYYVGKSIPSRHLTRVLDQLGFDILKTTAIMHCPRILAVILSRLLEKTASPDTARRFLKILKLFEQLAYLPTRYLTGYFMAVRAMKR